MCSCTQVCKYPNEFFLVFQLTLVASKNQFQKLSKHHLRKPFGLVTSRSSIMSLPTKHFTLLKHRLKNSAFWPFLCLGSMNGRGPYSEKMMMLSRD